MKFFVKYLFSKFSKFFSNFFSKFPADLVTFTEDIHNGKLHFLCIVEYTVNINVTEYFNPFVHNAPFFYPLKTSENLTISRRGLINLSTPFFLISTLTKTIKKTYLLFWRLMKNDSNNLYFHPCRTPLPYTLKQKIQRASTGFLMFSGGRERVHWERMG